MPYFNDPPERNVQLENALELLEIYRERVRKLQSDNELLRRKLYALEKEGKK